MLMNNSQMMGLTGRRQRPSWLSFYSEKANALPDLKRLGEQKTYQDSQIDLQDKSLGLQKQQLAAQNAYYDKQSDMSNDANTLNAVGLGLQGANTVNQLTGGAITGALTKGAGAATKWLGGAWDSISSFLPSFS